MSKRRISRRALLGGVGAGALAWPFLRALESKGHAANEFPQRFIAFFNPNGTVPQSWFPGGGETDFTLPAISAPLEPYRNRMNFFRGLNLGTAGVGPGGTHEQGMGHALTAAQLLPPTNPDAGAADAGLCTGKSIDQVIADHIGNESAFRSLECGIFVPPGYERPTNRLIYRGNGVALAPENDPVRVFERVFGDQTGDPEAVARRTARKQSVIDFAKADFDRVQKRIGKSDQQRLEQHKEGVLAVEKRLGLVGKCSEQAAPAGFNLNDERNMEAVSDAHMDIVVAAMACDMTRVASFQYTQAFASQTFAWLGLPLLTAGMGHHLLSHDVLNWYPDYVNSLVMIHTWYTRQFVKLLTKLEGISEGDGTMLDNTTVLWVSEIQRGTHELTNLPWSLAGNVGGKFKMGRNLVLPDRGHQQLLLSLVHAFGIDMEHFGDPAAAPGSLSELEA